MVDVLRGASRGRGAAGQQVGPAQLHIVIEIHPELSRGSCIQVLLEQVDLHKNGE